MKTTTLIFFSYLTIIGTFLPRVVPGAAPSKEKQSTQASAPSPAFIYPNPVIPLAKNQGATSEDMEKIKNMPEFTEEQKKCITSFGNKGMSSCLKDIGNSFVTEKIKVKPECCSALDGVNEPCRLAIHFQDKKFEGRVKEYCAAGPGGPSAQPAADGPGSEGGFGDGSFPDSTGQLSDFGSAFGPGPSEGPGPSPYGSYDESYGPSAAEGPSSEEASQEVGHMIEGSSPASNGDSVSEEAVGPIVEGPSPSSKGSTEGGSSNSDGSSKRGVGHKSKSPSPSPTSEGSSEGGAGTKSEGPSPKSSGSSDGAVGSKSEGPSPKSSGSSDGAVGSKSEGPSPKSSGSSDGAVGSKSEKSSPSSKGTLQEVGTSQ